MNIIKRWVEDFKAYRRGEVRISKGERGRVYQRKGEEQAESTGGGHAVARARASAQLKIKVTRADGTVEDYTVPAEVHHLGD